MLAPAPCSATPVQPRVRGERMTTSHTWPDGGGSAPRARGTESGIQPRHVSGRFSPACAGNGGPTRGPVGRTTVQPRVRGERATRESATRRQCGSAPRARGTGDEGECYSSAVRFSPACAGNGGRARPGPFLPSVQPRVRGERSGSRLAHGFFAGSAPRARGTVAKKLLENDVGRFSPACAGNGWQPRTIR